MLKPSASTSSIESKRWEPRKTAKGSELPLPETAPPTSLVPTFVTTAIDETEKVTAERSAITVGDKINFTLIQNFKIEAQKFIDTVSLLPPEEGVTIRNVIKEHGALCNALDALKAVKYYYYYFERKEYPTNSFFFCMCIVVIAVLLIMHLIVISVKCFRSDYVAQLCDSVIEWREAQKLKIPPNAKGSVKEALEARHNV